MLDVIDLFNKSFVRHLYLVDINHDVLVDINYDGHIFIIYINRNFFGVFSFIENRSLTRNVNLLPLFFYRSIKVIRRENEKEDTNQNMIKGTIEINFHLSWSK